MKIRMQCVEKEAIRETDPPHVAVEFEATNTDLSYTVNVLQLCAPWAETFVVGAFYDVDITPTLDAPRKP